MQNNLMHVLLVIDNPIRYSSRYRLYFRCLADLIAQGVQITVVECQQGDRPFQCAVDGINFVGVRSKTVLWTKENLQNIGVRHLPQGWKYLTTLDADVLFRKKEWGAETVHALQQYDIVQPWDTCYDLGPNDEHVATHTSLMKLFKTGKQLHQGPNGKAGYEFGHPGYCWAWTRDALERISGRNGPFLETAILGAADHHMGMGLIGKAVDTIPGNIGGAYRREVLNWEKRALQHVNFNVSYVANTIEHPWHGKKERRFYVERWGILAQNDFDPDVDLKHNTFGVIELAGNKPKLAHQIDGYMRSRDEDANSLF